MLKTQKKVDNEIDEILRAIKKFPPSVIELFPRDSLEEYSKDYANGDFIEVLFNLSKDESILKNIRHLENLLLDKKHANYFAGNFFLTLIEGPYNWREFYSKEPTNTERGKIESKLKKQFDAIIKTITDNDFIYGSGVILGEQPIIPLLKKIRDELCFWLDPNIIGDTILPPRKRNDSKIDITFTSNILAAITNDYLKNPCYDIIADCLYARFGKRCEGITGDHVRKNYRATYTEKWLSRFAKYGK